MSELEASILINLDGNLPQQSRRFAESVSRFTDSGNRRLSLMRRATAALGRQVDSLGNRYTALLTGAAGGAAVKFVADLDAQLRRTATDANLTDEQMNQLKQRLFEVAAAPEVRIDATQLFSAFDTILSKTGDLPFAEANIRSLGLTMQGLGADAETAGGLLAQYWEKGIRAPDAVMAANDRIFTQFGKGSLAASEIARVAPGLFSIIQKQGPAAVAEMGALAQLFVKTTGSADEAVTAIQAVFETFIDPQKVAIIENSDIQVFTDTERKVLRPANELLREIVETANENTGVLARVFDSTALGGLKSLLRKENRDLLDALTDGTVELGRTQRAAAKNAQSLNAAMENLHTVLKRYADSQLAGPIQSIADALNSVDPKIINTLLTSILALGGIYVAGKSIFKLVDIGAKARRQFSSDMNSEGGSDNPLLNAADNLVPVPVYVVNAPSGITGRGGPPTLRRGRNPYSFGSLRNQRISNLGALGALGVARAAGFVGLAGAAGYGTGTLLHNTLLEGTDLSDQIGRAVAKGLALLGVESARETLQAEERATKIQIELTGNAAPQARINNLEGNGEVEISGSIMGIL